MANALKQAVLLQNNRSPLIQFQRFRGKINIQRPQKLHYERARFVAVTTPELPQPPKTASCFVPTSERYQKNIENPYNKIIAREVLNWLNHSKMVAIFHMNSMTSDELFRTRVELHKQNMHLKSYGRAIVEEAIGNTRYEALRPLFVSSNYIVFSPEQNVAKLLRLTKKVPQMLLLAGIVENRLLSRNELVAYSQLPGLQAAQAELVNTLNSAASNVVQQLQAHQNNFVNILDVYAKSNEDSSATSTNTEAANEETKSE